MAGQITRDDSIRDSLIKQGFFQTESGRWMTRKEIMVRARYGNDIDAVRRAIQAVKDRWHTASHIEGGRGA